MKNKDVVVFRDYKSVQKHLGTKIHITKVFTSGCFDVLHFGHIDFLQQCNELGYVIVGINSDWSVSELKGKTRPIFPVDDRVAILSACRYVDMIVIFEELNPQNLIKVIKPNIYAKDDMYSICQLKGDCKYSPDTKIVRIPRNHNYSSTRIIKQCCGR